MSPKPNEARRKRVLVVDDCPIPAKMVATVLRNAGYEVSVAHDGRKALRKSQEQQFDLVLSDEQMPQMNGSELCRRLRATPRYRKTPFVLFTSKRWSTDIDRIAREVNIAATVYKAFRPADLLDAVDTILQSCPLSPRGGEG